MTDEKTKKDQEWVDLFREALKDKDPLHTRPFTKEDFLKFWKTVEGWKNFPRGQCIPGLSADDILAMIPPGTHVIVAEAQDTLPINGAEASAVYVDEALTFTREVFKGHPMLEGGDRSLLDVYLDPIPPPGDESIHNITNIEMPSLLEAVGCKTEEQKVYSRPLGDPNNDAARKEIVDGNEIPGRLGHLYLETPEPEGVFKKHKSEVQFYFSDGAFAGIAVYDGGDRFIIKDKPEDIKVGDVRWFLAGVHKGDPEVRVGKVTRLSFESDYRWPKGEFSCWFRLLTGDAHEHHCYEENIFRTPEEAEAKRTEYLKSQLEKKDK